MLNAWTSCKDNSPLPNPHDQPRSSPVPRHRPDPAKYGVQAEPAVFQNLDGLRPGEMLQRKFDLKATLKADTDKEMEP
jgi:hypothetical protein